MIRSALGIPRRWGLATLLLLVIGSPDARAGFTLRLSPTTPTIVAGQSTDVAIQLVTDAGGGGDLYGFTAAVYLDNPLAGLSITGATQPSSNYVFAGNSLGFGANLVTPFGDPSTTRVVVFDIPDNPIFVPIGANQTFDLAVITIASSNITSGTARILFDQDFSRLDDATGTGFPVKFLDGQLSVTGSSMSAVPGPSSLLLGCLGTILLAAPRLRRSTHVVQTP